MIVAAIVCAAAFAHAGAYTWGLTAGDDKASDGSTYLTDGPFTVMLFIGSIGQTLNADGKTYSLDFTNAKYVTQTSDYAKDYDYSIGAFKFDPDRTSANVDTSQKQAYSILVLDTGANITDYVNYQGTYAIVTGESALNTNPAAYSAFKYDVGVTGDKYHTAAVPEPTSGLLLLLGVAGLALKRRCA